MEGVFFLIHCSLFIKILLLFVQAARSTKKIDSSNTLEYAKVIDV